MSKRLTIQCWNCPKTYFENLAIARKQEFIVRCPYCNSQEVVNLRPYQKQSKITTVYCGEDKETIENEEFQLPDVPSSRKPE